MKPKYLVEDIGTFKFSKYENAQRLVMALILGSYNAKIESDGCFYNVVAFKLVPVEEKKVKEYR